VFNNIKDLVIEARKSPILKLVVAAAEDRVVLKSVKEAYEMGIIEPILVGNKLIIEEILINLNYRFKGEIIASESNEESANIAMELITNGNADFPMKGLLSTKTILKALLNKKYGLRKNSLLSLVSLIYLEKDNRIIILTDGGMNIAPDLNEKVQIINNAIEVAHAIGIDMPRVAVLAAVELVNPAMPETLDATALSKMVDRGQIKGAIVDGPLAFDNAISIESARHKGIDSPVAGRADILIVPDIEAGNILYKSLVFYSGLDAASVVFGAKVPLVLTSRADSAEVKLNSIALAKMIALVFKNIKEVLN
jgi:phosphate butyryltransferase